MTEPPGALWGSVLCPRKLWYVGNSCWESNHQPLMVGWQLYPPEPNQMKIFHSQIVYFKLYLYSERVKLHPSSLVVVPGLGLGTSLSKTNRLIQQQIIEEMLCHEVETGLFSWFIQSCFYWGDHCFFYETAPRIGVGISGHLTFRFRFKDSFS